MILFPFNFSNVPVTEEIVRSDLNHLAIETTNEGVLITGKDGTLCYANDKVATLLGCTIEMISGRPVFEFVDPEYRSIVISHFKDRCSNIYTKKTYHVKLQRADGRVIFALVSSIAILNDKGDYNGSLVMLTDVSDAVQANQLFNTAFAMTPSSMAICRMDGTFVCVNDEFCRLTGYEREEVIGRDRQALDLWVDQKLMADVVQAIARDGVVQQVQGDFRTKSGKIITGLFNAEAVKLDGESYFLSAVCDITERLQYERELKNEKERFAHLFHANPCPMVISSLDGKIVEVNEAYIAMAGYKRDELVNRRWKDIGLFPFEEDLAKARHQFIQKGGLRNFEIRIRTKTGDMLTALLCSDITTSNEQHQIISTVIDVTDMRRYEAELAHMDRLYLLGQMAASISHEVRNPLTTVRGFLQLIQAREKYRDDSDHFDLMIDELDRANTIITEFLSLAKNRHTVFELTDLNNLIQTMHPLLSAAAAKESKEIKLELGSIPAVEVEPKEIRQVVLNLVRNGLDASSPYQAVIIKTFLTDTSIVLAVENHGEPIPRELLDQLGTPFFTTKKNGTGLGLAICQSIIERHRASMEIHTDQDKTAFWICFSRHKLRGLSK